VPPEISVITPSYNQGQFIERTIQSVLSQDVSQLEYFVADGGSTDETVGILKKYENRLDWVSEKDGGQTDAVNKGIRATSGEIIGWLNSDDIYYPGVLIAVKDFFDSHPDVDVIYGNANHIDTKDGVIEPYYTEDWDYERLKEICFICQPSVFFRRSIIEQAGLFDEKLQYCMDYELWLRLGKLTNFVRLNKTLSGSRLYADNKTLGARIPVHKEINDMFKEKFARVPDKWIFAFAHVFVDEKGYDRRLATDNIKFVLFTGLMVFVSSFRWQQTISMSAVRTIFGWFRELAKSSLMSWK